MPCEPTATPVGWNRPDTGRVVTARPSRLIRTSAPGTVGGASSPAVPYSVAGSRPFSAAHPGQILKITGLS